MMRPKKKVPVWLADEANSGVFTVWMNLFLQLPLDDLVFISDAPDINPGLSRHFITSEEFLESHSDYTLPLMNLGTSRYYAKQLDFLFKRGGYVWFHQLYLHRLIENYYLRGQRKDPVALVRYGRAELGELGATLATLGEMNGLTAREYYTRTFAKQIAAQSIGFCSSWSGAFECLHAEGLDRSHESKFHYMPPVYLGSREKIGTVPQRKDYESRPLRLGILGHYNAMKNPEYCFEVVKSLNEQGLPAKLVAIGRIGEALSDKLNLEDRQLLETHQAPQHSRFLKLLASLDGNLHFRRPFGGEMSATITESMSQCVPSVGFATDFLADIPEDLRVSIDPDSNPADAASEIIRAIGSPSDLTALKQRLANYMDRETSMEDGIRKIEEIIQFIRQASLDSKATQLRKAI